jgi:hypothetical protein
LVQIIPARLALHATGVVVNIFGCSAAPKASASTWRAWMIVATAAARSLVGGGSGAAVPAYLRFRHGGDS